MKRIGILKDGKPKKKREICVVRYKIKNRVFIIIGNKAFIETRRKSVIAMEACTKEEISELLAFLRNKKEANKIKKI